MRLSTSTLYSMGARSIQNQQSQVAKLGEQISARRRVVNPADDPRAAARALGVSHASDVNHQFADSRTDARTKLLTEQNELDNVTDALAAAKSSLVRAGNGTLSDSDRVSVADKLEGIYNQLLGSANAQDGQGRYIFSGYKSDTQPFQGAPGGLGYKGGSAQQKITIVGGRTIAAGNTGEQVFDSVNASSGYVGTAGSANSGTATFANLHTTDTSAAGYGDRYTLIFDNGGAQPTYSVLDAAGNAVQSNQAYTAGQDIALGNGVSVRIEGEPANGDRLTFGQDNNILNAIHDTVAKLRAGTASDVDAAALSNTLSSADARLGNALDNVVSVQASLGARLNELDVLDAAGQTQQINYQQTLSGLEGLDTAKAISQYSLAKVALKLSQKTFSDIQGLSLFGLTR